MDALRPRHLVFEDVSGTLARIGSSEEQSGRSVETQQALQSCVTAGPTVSESVEALELQLKQVARDVQEAHDTVRGRLDTQRKTALAQLESTGGRLALESHLKAQKATWKFVGQKEAFLDRLKQLRHWHELLQHDFASDIAIADKAVQTLKEDIRDRNSAISKVEQELQGIIKAITRSHESCNMTSAQLAPQLAQLMAELRDWKTRQQELPDTTVNGMTEEELARLVAEEEARAADLERQAASEAAAAANHAAEYTALEERVRELREEVEKMEEERSAAAKKEGAKYEEELNRFDTLLSAIARLRGVEVVGHDDSTVRVSITMTIPHCMPGREAPCSAATATGASGVGASASDKPSQTASADTDGVVVEHVLTLHFEAPDTARLQAAALYPPVVDIGKLVEAAQRAQTEENVAETLAVVELLMDVKARVWAHHRRQLLLEDANEVYPLQPTSVSPQLLRCVLPNKVEVEVLVPMAWPDLPGTQLELLQLEAPRSSQDLSPLLSRLQKELREAQAPDGASSGGGGGVQAELLRRQLRGCSLRDLLDWVYGRLAKEIGA